MKVEELIEKYLPKDRPSGSKTVNFTAVLNDAAKLALILKVAVEALEDLKAREKHLECGTCTEALSEIERIAAT